MTIKLDANDLTLAPYDNISAHDKEAMESIDIRIKEIIDELRDSFKRIKENK